MKLEKSGLGVSNGERVNAKVVEANKINQLELKHKFFEIADNPSQLLKVTKRTLKGSH